MKKKNKDDFHFLRATFPNGKLEWITWKPVNRDTYFKKEIKFIKQFPFIKREWILYKLIDNMWVEQTEE